MRVILLGPPGAGKGTQAVLLAQHAKIPHISTGEIMRQAVASQSTLGLQVKKYLDAGELVPDVLVINLIRERLAQADAASGFLLDGFPRTLEQAQALTKLLAEIQRPITHVIELKVPDAVLLERVRKRGEAGSGRSDDSEQVMAKRLQVYWQQTAPVSSYYRAETGIIELDGLGSIDEVQAKIFAAVS